MIGVLGATQIVFKTEVCILMRCVFLLQTLYISCRHSSRKPNSSFSPTLICAKSETTAIYSINGSQWEMQIPGSFDFGGHDYN